MVIRVIRVIRLLGLLGLLGLLARPYSNSEVCTQCSLRLVSCDGGWVTGYLEFVARQTARSEVTRTRGVLRLALPSETTEDCFDRDSVELISSSSRLVVSCWCSGSDDDDGDVIESPRTTGIRAWQDSKIGR